MGKTQPELQLELETLIGNRNVYYQPPSNIKMQYPCIRYTWIKIKPDYANNFIYNYLKAYEVTVVDTKKNSDIPEKLLLHFPYISLNKIYSSDGLWHFTFTLYY